PQLAEFIGGKRGDVAAAYGNAACLDAPVARQVAQHRERGRRFPAAGFADEPIRFAASDAQRHVLKHVALMPARAIRDGEADDRQRVGRAALGRAERGKSGWRRSVHRSSTPCTASATRLTATTSVAIAAASNTTVHQAPPAISV